MHSLSKLSLLAVAIALPLGAADDRPILPAKNQPNLTLLTGPYLTSGPKQPTDRAHLAEVQQVTEAKLKLAMAQARLAKLEAEREALLKKRAELEVELRMLEKQQRELDGPAPAIAPK